VVKTEDEELEHRQKKTRKITREIHEHGKTNVNKSTSIAELNKSTSIAEFPKESENDFELKISPEKQNRQPVRKRKSKVKLSYPCPCGSGKKYKKCCGKSDN